MSKKSKVPPRTARTEYWAKFLGSSENKKSTTTTYVLSSQVWENQVTDPPCFILEPFRRSEKSHFRQILAAFGENAQNYHNNLI